MKHATKACLPHHTALHQQQAIQAECCRQRIVWTLLSCLLLLCMSAVHLQAETTGEEEPVAVEVTRLAAGMEHAMIEVRAARIDPDRMLPWRNSTPRWQTGYGVAVAPGLFLVSEPLIRNQTALQVRQAGSLQPAAAQVVRADPRVGLALISAIEENWFPDAIPLEVHTRIPREGDFIIVQWGANDHLQAGIGNLLSIGFDSVGPGIPDQLTFELTSSLRYTQTGTPILYEGQLAGLAMQFGGRRRAPLLISPDSISGFLTASRQTEYTGVPEPDFAVAELADPVHRRYLGVPAASHDRGIYVQAAHNGSDPAPGLQPHDVLLRWDDMELDARGTYEHPLYGRIPFQHLLAQRTPGDRVPVTIVRDRAIQDIEVTVRPYAAVERPIPENAIRTPDDYVVAAGFVFRELTVDFLEGFGDQWQRRADIDLTWHMQTLDADPEAPGYRTVFLVTVLADPINIGYRDLRTLIVKQVNGHPIRNLADLADRINQEGLTSVTLSKMEAIPLAFDPEQVEAANIRIQQRFQIPALQRLTPPHT